MCTFWGKMTMYHIFFRDDDTWDLYLSTFSLQVSFAFSYIMSAHIKTVQLSPAHVAPFYSSRGNNETLLILLLSIENVIQVWSLLVASPDNNELIFKPSWIGVLWIDRHSLWVCIFTTKMRNLCWRKLLYRCTGSLQGDVPTHSWRKL